MESDKSQSMKISHFGEYFKIQLRDGYYEGKNKFGMILTNINTNLYSVYTNVYDNLNNKLQIPYTYEDLNNKDDMGSYEKKIKEYGILFGNFVTNIVVDSVDNFKIVKNKTLMLLYD